MTDLFPSTKGISSWRALFFEDWASCFCQRSESSFHEEELPIHYWPPVLDPDEGTHSAYVDGATGF
ncbi:hypothetical protein [Dyella terrae]|uniref:hypothetical protein n=1 Tax=Dyella terrae TaxID=522259 RepID=UPI001EFD2300|nr:hypothetical protein [Dyella terrae]